MNKIYFFIPLFIIALLINVFPKQTPPSTSLLNATTENILALPGVITVVTPNGAESWQAGSSQIISWTDDITENVLIELYKAGSLNSVISTSTASDGSYVWNI